MIKNGLITQDEALSHADSATNLLWLLNNNEKSSKLFHPEPQTSSLDEASFTEFTLNA